MLRGSTGLSFVALGFLVQCGASQEQVNTIDKQVKELQKVMQQQTNQDQTKVEERLGQVETNTIESIKKMEQMLEVLQREVTAMSAATDTPSAISAPAAKTSSRVWYDVKKVVGLSGTGIKEEGDTYTINATYLEQELALLAQNAKGFKITAVKEGGLALKGIKPKTILALLGLRPNDVIMAIGDKPIASTEELFKALQEAKSPMTVKIQRKKQEIVKTYKLEE